jgi:hypothetical protein
MCPSEAACLLQTVVSTSSTITILLSVLSCTKQKLLSSRQNVNCSRHDIAEKTAQLALNNIHLLTHFLTHLNVPCMR